MHRATPKCFAVGLRLLALLAFLVLARCASAQATGDSAVYGRAFAPDGAPLADAQIVLTPFRSPDDLEGTRPPLTVTADRHGWFFLLHVAPGNYRAEARDARSGELATADAWLESGSASELDLKLAPVSSATPKSRKPATDVADQDAITPERLADLSTEADAWGSIARLFSQAHDATPASRETPGEERDGGQDSAEVARGGGSESGAVSAASGPSFAGLPVTQNRETVDGLSAQQNFRSGPRGSSAGGPVTGSSFAQSAVRSLRVFPRTFSAQYGNAASGALAITSRSGGDQVHGGGTYVFRASAFAATNPFSVVTHYSDGAISTSLVKPQDTLKNFSAHIGLPFADLLHRPTGKHSPVLFASLNEQLRQHPVISTPSIASFYALSAMQTALLRNRGVTLAAQNAALNYLDGLSGNVDRAARRLNTFFRIENTLNQHNQLAFTYTLQRFTSPAGSGFDQASEAVTARGRASVGDQTVQLDAPAAHWLQTFSPHASNQLHLQWVRDVESEQPRTPLAQEPAIGPGGFAPQVSISPDGFAYGTPAGLGRAAYPDEQRYEAADMLQTVRAHHLFSVGFDWSRVRDRIGQLNNAEGSFLYDSGTTNGHAGGLVDWITDSTFNVHAYPNGGCPSINAAVHNFCFRSFTQSFGGEQTEFVTHDFAGFIEDNFRARAGLTLTLGVRYEYTLLPLPQTPNAALDAAFANIGGPVRGTTASFPEDRNNFGPRVALAWRPAQGRFGSVHLGYGMFFGRLTGATVRAALTNTALPSTTTQVRITPTTITGCPQVPNQGFGFPCTYTSAPPAVVAQTSSTMMFAQNFRLPAVQRGSLVLEREVGRHVTFRAEYAVSIAAQLPGSVDLNIAPATTSQAYVLQGGEGHPGLHSGQTFSLPLYTARHVTQYGPITAIVSNANATYHAGTLEAALRGLHSLELHGSFTFSRAIDYGPQLSATPRQNGQFDPFTNGYDKGLSTLDFPERFTGEMVYHSHLRHGPAAVRRMLSDWQLAAIAFAGSGAPYSYAIFGGTRLSGGRESLNGSGGANYLPTVGRNTLRLPARGSVDLRFGREWNTGPRLRVSAFAEAFNLLNSQNVARVQTRAFLLGTPIAGAPTPLIFQDAATIAAEGLATRPFGVPTSSTTGLSRERQAEFGIRLSF